MTRAKPRDNLQPSGAEECEALKAEVLRALCTILRHGFPQDYDFGVEVSKTGTRFTVGFWPMEQLPSEPVTGEYCAAMDTDANQRYADEEWAVADSACNELVNHLGGSPFAEDKNPHGLARNYENDYFTGTKQQLVAALDAAFVKSKQPMIANPLLTVKKER